MGQALPHQSLIKKTPVKLAYRPMEAFHSLQSPFVNESSLCQSDVNQPARYLCFGSLRPPLDNYHLGLSPGVGIHLSLNYTPCSRRSQHLVLYFSSPLRSILALQGVLQIFLGHGGNTKYSHLLKFTLMQLCSEPEEWPPRLPLLLAEVFHAQCRAFLICLLGGFHYLRLFTLWRPDSNEHAHSVHAHGGQKIVGRDWFLLLPWGSC